MSILRIIRNIKEKRRCNSQERPSIITQAKQMLYDLDTAILNGDAIPDRFWEEWEYDDTQPVHEPEELFDRLGIASDIKE